LRAAQPHSMGFYGACPRTCRRLRRLPARGSSCPRAFNAAPPTRINADERNSFAGLLDGLTQRAEAATQEVPHLDKTAAVGESVSGLILSGPPLKPSGYVIPVHTTSPKLTSCLIPDINLSRSGELYEMLSIGAGPKGIPLGQRNILLAMNQRESLTVSGRSMPGARSASTRGIC
jgi:hypothetical protein